MAKNNFAVGESPNDKLLACIQLARCIPSLARDRLFMESIPAIVSRPEYGFFTLFPPGESEVGKLLGAGLFAVYDDAWNARMKLAVEAAWFIDAEAAREGIDGLIEVVHRHGLRDLHLKPETIVPREPIDDLVAQTTWHSTHIRREPKALLQSRSDGLWSAYTGRTTTAARFADCVQIILPSPISLAGVEYSGTEPLYRGEGRIGREPYAECSSASALIARIHADGFSSRGDGAFSGSLPDQIRHQGYVNSPTVSLTADHRVAAEYATSRGQQPIGVVFTIDADALRAHGPIWDSFESMRAHHRAFFESDFESMVDLVGKCTVLEAGHLLEGLYSGLSKRSQQYSEDLRLQAPLAHYVEHTVWARALELLGEQSLSSLCSVLEHACSLRDGGSTTETVVAGPYSLAFELVSAELVAALEAGRKRSSPWQHAGWDTTVFGYMAKTCRDREFFSSGMVPREAIKEARIVHSPDQWEEAIANPNWSSR
jgi:hypothetical protein